MRSASIDDLSRPSGSLTIPLGLASLRKSPRPLFPFLAFLDFCAIGCIFVFLSTNFVFSPGISLDLPASQEMVTDALPAMAVLTVLSAGGTERLLFRGRIFSLEDARFEQELEKFAGQHASGRSILLVKLDRYTGTQTLFRICGLARKAGVGRLHLASTSESS
tara:strand:+ start:614 stop:1102 length:489 start_codon:yes stop_codon:yes gene_type:complete